MIPARWFGIFWAGWLVAFAIVEGIALFDRAPGDTFSEHIWRWFGVGGKISGWTLARRTVLGAFLGWLLMHLTLGWWST